jgi:hypothetical protein
LKIIAPAELRALSLVSGILTMGPALGQHVTIERCQPAILQAGKSVEVHLSGRGLKQAMLWTSFPATVERIDEKASRFQITTDFIGAGAIRAHGEDGVSNLFFVTLDANESRIVPTESRTRSEDAQGIEIPAMVDGDSANLGSHYYRFEGKKGKTVEISAIARGSSFDGVLTIRSAAEGKRLVQADDSDGSGADPWIEFVPPADGDYVLELSDSQYRGGQGYRLTVEKPGSGIPDNFKTVWIVDEGDGQTPISAEISDTRFAAALEGSNDVDTFSFSVSERTFLNITPYARAIRSPVTPRLKLTDSGGKILAETPHDSFEELPLRLWLEKGADYRLAITDAFGCAGSYQFKLDREAIPYELTIPGQRDKKHPLQDKFLAVQGGVFEVPVHCRRHQFDEVIELHLESEIACTSANARIAKGQENLNLRIRLAQDVVAGTLATLRVRGTAKDGEQTFEQSLKTGKVLVERDAGAEIPKEADGALAVRVIESPLVVEVTPPTEVGKGSAVTIPVKIVWCDEKRVFNTTLRLKGLPAEVHTSEKKLNTKDTTTGLELKVGNPGKEDLKDLRVEVRLDYYKQTLLVESAPFTVRITDKDEKKD